MLSDIVRPKKNSAAEKCDQPPTFCFSQALRLILNSKPTVALADSSDKDKCRCKTEDDLNLTRHEVTLTVNLQKEQLYNTCAYLEHQQITGTRCSSINYIMLLVYEPKNICYILGRIVNCYYRLKISLPNHIAKSTAA